MAPPVHVVIPVKDHLDLTQSILNRLRQQGGYDRILVYDHGSGRDTATWLAAVDGHDRIEVVDAGGWGFYDMWQDGVEQARQHCPGTDIAILNNDLVLGPDFLSSLSRALHSDPKLWAVSPRYDGQEIDGLQYVTGTFKDHGLAGFAFMVRGAAFDHVAFDRAFHLWYGDDDLVAQIESLGRKVGITGATWVEHIGGGSQTLRHEPGIDETLERDRDRMIAKWGAAGPMHRQLPLG